MAAWTHSPSITLMPNEMMYPLSANFFVLSIHHRHLKPQVLPLVSLSQRSTPILVSPGGVSEDILPQTWGLSNCNGTRAGEIAITIQKNQLIERVLLVTLSVYHLPQLPSTIHYPTSIRFS